MTLKRIIGQLCFLFLTLHLFAAEYRTPRISPLPIRIDQQKVDLNGTWKFNPSPGETRISGNVPKEYTPIEVPGEWAMQGFEVKTGMFASYYRTFGVPKQWSGQRIKLRCNGVYSFCRIYVNGQECGTHMGGFTAFEIDVTQAIKTGVENQIEVLVQSENVADSTSNASRYAVHPLGGISRDIYLFALPERNLSVFHATTHFDSTYTNAVLKVEAEVSNESLLSADRLSLSFLLSDPKGNKVPLKSNIVAVPTLEKGSSWRVEVPFEVTAPEKWDSEHPNLYTLVCQLKEGDRIVCESQRRVGFRQVEVRGNQMFINNHPVKLRGVCRHEVMPLRGRSLTGDIWSKDVELFRQGNVNYIRTSHYPADERLLEACDELGMLVEVEAPFCWAHETKVSDRQYDQVLVNQHVEMVHLLKSHPSIVMWSIGNESNLFKEYFKKASDVVKAMDSTRPRVFSQWKPDGDDGVLEIANHHYPGPKGADLYRTSERPVVFDEFCHLNAYNRFELATDPSLREKWGEVLDRMWEAMYHSQGVLGGAIWAGIDDTFFLPQHRAVGYGTWGVIDGWRRPKPEYWGMKKAFTPVKIRLEGNCTDEGVVRFEIENRHNFSSLSECRLEWSVGDSTGVIHTDLSPRSKGSAEIRLPASLRNVDQLKVKVIGVRGFVVDEYLFRIKPEIVVANKVPKGNTVSFREEGEHYVIRTNGVVYKVNKRNGLLSAERKGTDVLRSSPSLMILPLNEEGDGIQMTGKGQMFDPYNPLCENWTASSLSTHKSDQKVVVRVEGSYKESKGFFEYCFDRGGAVEISYDFQMKLPVNPRQIGIVFSLPSSFRELRWEREGYWSVYPENHIGALRGSVLALNPNVPISGLAGPSALPTTEWSMDQTEAGCNLFRSTKENIYRASLNDDSQQMEIQSEGDQHIRTWIAGDQIKLLVADYNNAGKERFLVPHVEGEYRPLRPGDRVSGKVKFQLIEK